MGIKENENNFSIQTFALLPQDQIFIGTDGKDDVYIKDNLGNKYMNEDEALILRKIETKVKETLNHLARNSLLLHLLRKELLMLDLNKERMVC